VVDNLDVFLVALENVRLIVAQDRAFDGRVANVAIKVNVRQVSRAMVFMFQLWMSLKKI
jgi:hypothetical protein